MVIEDSPTGPWRFTHQKDYSRIPNRIAQRYTAEKFHYNVCTSHIHDWGLTRPQGWYALSPGCLHDPDKAEYKKIRDTLHPEWDVGWATIDEEGVPQIYQPRRTTR